MEEDAAVVEAEAETIVLVEEQVNVLLEAEEVASFRELSNSRNFC